MGKIKQFTHDDLLQDVISMSNGVSRVQAEDEFTVEDFRIKSGLSDSVVRLKIKNLIESRKIECSGWVRLANGKQAKAYRKVQHG